MQTDGGLSSPAARLELSRKRGSTAQYQDSYRLCYVLGPEGIMVALAEQLS